MHRYAHSGGTIKPLFTNLSPNQTGFRASCSVSNNLVKLLGKAFLLRQQADKKTESFILFIDLKAAFDSVDHKILFEKLQRYGVDEAIINSIRLIYSHVHT